LSQIISISNKYSSDIEFVAISSNDVANYPEDSPQKMKEMAAKLNFKFPYLYDETQEIAKKYQAACTPEFYLFDKNNLLIYRGRIDDSSPGNGKEPSGKDLRNAIDAFLSGKKISDQQNPSMGCNIKWKNE
jgi:peroxiredoxin